MTTMVLELPLDGDTMNEDLLLEHWQNLSDPDIPRLVAGGPSQEQRSVDSCCGAGGGNRTHEG